MNADLKLFSLKELFTRLHNDLKAFVDDTRNALSRNNEVDFNEISKVREHITERLKLGENIEDNEAILKVLNLFTMDKAFIQITSEEAEGWLNFLDAIADSLKNLDQYATTKEERHDIDEINDAVQKARNLLRK